MSYTIVDRHKQVVLVAGTHGLRQPHAWWRPGSAFGRALEGHGHFLLNRRRAFCWTTRLGGLPWWGKRLDWSVAGEGLYWYVRANISPRRRPSGIFHSHGGQVWAYSTHFGLEWDTVITMGTPVRHDMQGVYEGARRRTSRWVHLHAGGDWVQTAGALFDGHFGLSRRMPLADLNVLLPWGLHGSTDPKEWSRLGLWAHLDGATQ